MNEIINELRKGLNKDHEFIKDGNIKLEKSLEKIEQNRIDVEEIAKLIGLKKTRKRGYAGDYELPGGELIDLSDVKSDRILNAIFNAGVEKGKKDIQKDVRKVLGMNGE